MNNINFFTLSDHELLNLIKTGVREALKEVSPVTPTAEDELLALAAAAQYLMIAEQTLYTYTSQRKIPFLKKGKKLYFRKSDLNQWLESGRKKTATEISADAQSFTSKRNQK